MEKWFRAAARGCCACGSGHAATKARRACPSVCADVIGHVADQPPRSQAGWAASPQDARVSPSKNFYASKFFLCIYRSTSY
jgi:hypothetical protein